MRTRYAPLACALGLLLMGAAPVHAQLQAPNEKATVAAVRAAHPEIDPCDDTSLQQGRAAIVDWTAQRLNARDGAVRWGRKSSSATPRVKNTDALAFKRTDGLFELYDVISGGKPCNASWQVPTKALRPGENGWWAPPQLGPEPGTANPEPPPPAVDPPTPPAGDAATADLQRQQLAALREIVTQLREQNVALAQGLAELQAAIAAGVRIRF